MELINIHTHQVATNNKHIVQTLPETNMPDGLYTCGIHPWHITNVEAQMALLQKHAANANCIAIGECGLDGVCKTKMDLQLQAFAAQIQLAMAVNKPLILHAVRSSQQVIQQLQKFKCTQPVIIHGFNNRENIADAYLQEGYYISFGKALLQGKSNAQQVLKHIPLDKLFLETDTENTLTIESIYNKAATILNLPLNSLVEQVEKNFTTIFGR